MKEFYEDKILLAFKRKSDGLFLKLSSPPYYALVAEWVDNPFSAYTRPEPVRQPGNPDFEKPWADINAKYYLPEQFEFLANELTIVRIAVHSRALELMD